MKFAIVHSVDIETTHDHLYSWAQYLRSIKLLLETGEGEPFGCAGSRLARTTR